jgi:hypothetical protein
MIVPGFEACPVATADPLAGSLKAKPSFTTGAPTRPLAFLGAI